MKMAWKIVIVLAIIAAVVGVITYKNKCCCPDCTGGDNAGGGNEVNKNLPTLVYIGQNCVTCQQVKPVIKAFREEFAGRVNVMTPDPTANGVREKYPWKTMPYFFFCDASGEIVGEVGGVQSREDLLTAFSQCGIDLTGEQKPPTPTTRTEGF